MMNKRSLPKLKKTSEVFLQKWIILQSCCKVKCEMKKDVYIYIYGWYIILPEKFHQYAVQNLTNSFLWKKLMQNYNLNFDTYKINCFHNFKCPFFKTKSPSKLFVTFNNVNSGIVEKGIHFKWHFSFIK